MAQLLPRTIFHKRLYVVYGVVLLVACICIYKLVQLQLVHHDTFLRLAENQYVGVVPTILERGDIYFTTREGEHVTAATIAHGYKAYINPTLVNNTDELIASLSEHIPDLDRDRVRQRITVGQSTSDTYEEVAWRLSKKQAEGIRSMNNSAIGLGSDQWRYYPGDDVASHVVGFVGYQGDQLEGRYGLEKYYQSTLVRQGDNTRTNFFAQVYGNNTKDNKSKKNKQKNTDALPTLASAQGDLVTTIDPQVQTFVDTQVRDIHNTWKSAQTGAIVIDPTTGAIKAMSTSERFDLNDLSQVSNEQLANPFVERVYEMGSIIKPLIMAMAIEEGVLTPATAFYDSGSVKVGDFTIHNFDKKGRGQITMTEVLQQSLNTGMVWISQHLSWRTMRDYLTELGLRDTTGVDLPYEIKSLTSNLDTGRVVEYANVSFGQGIALTPIVTVQALTALANHGTPSTPYIVDTIDRVGRPSQKIEHAVHPSVFSVETTETVARMLVGLVDDSFKPKYPALEPYSIAAKTGTAQVAHPQGGYYSDRNLHSFFGYFPAYQPQYLIFFYTLHPKGVRYSSETLSGPFMTTTQFLVDYYDIAPDRVIVE